METLRNRSEKSCIKVKKTIAGGFDCGRLEEVSEALAAPDESGREGRVG
jgi:hypothetical protein